MATCAFLGLGVMGYPMAGHLTAAGHSVTVFNRTSAKSEAWAAQYDGSAKGTPREAAEGADFVMACVGNDDDLRSVCLGEDGAFAGMKPGSTLINIGRGSLVNEDELLAALDKGCPARAVLDVFQEEPLPGDHALWVHPGVTVTPHVSGWHLDGGLPVIAENYSRLSQGQPLVNEVDRSLGY